MLYVRWNYGEFCSSLWIYSCIWVECSFWLFFIHAKRLKSFRQILIYFLNVQQCELVLHTQKKLFSACSWIFRYFSVTWPSWKFFIYLKTSIIHLFVLKLTLYLNTQYYAINMSFLLYRVKFHWSFYQIVNLWLFIL